MQVVGEVDAEQAPGGRGVDRHVVRGVVQELGPAVALDVVRVVVAPAQLHVDPVLGRGGPVVGVLLLVQEGGLRDLPFEGCEEEDICTGGVHLVGLSGVDCLLLDGLDLERVELHVEYLAEIHYNRLMYLLP